MGTISGGLRKAEDKRNTMCQDHTVSLKNKNKSTLRNGIMNYVTRTVSTVNKVAKLFFSKRTVGGTLQGDQAVAAAQPCCRGALSGLPGVPDCPQLHSDKPKRI